MQSATKNVDIMLGEPKKALLYLMVPIAVALLVQQSNNIVDSMWVTGLGSGAMAALGLVNPIYTTILGIGNGMAIGTAAAIARNIGMGRKERADRLAAQSIILIVIIGIIITPVLLITAEPVLSLIGATDTMSDSVAYAIPLYASSTVLMLSCMMSGILRGEGAMRRSMYIQILAAGLNIILDPIFIYIFGWGVQGAAIATVVAAAISIVLGLYWYLVRKDMFLKIEKSHFKIDRNLVKDITVVGNPQTMELCIMALFDIVYNLCILAVATSSTVAVYTVVWRIIFLAIIPAQAIGGAMVSICSAEYGMKKYDMLKKSFGFSVKFTFIITSVIAIMLILAANPIASLFTSAPDMQAMHGDMVVMSMILFMMVPFFSMVFVGSAMLQSVSRSKVSMWSSFTRNLTLGSLLSLVIVPLGNEVALWWTITAVEVGGGLLMLLLARIAIRSLEARDKPNNPVPGNSL